MDKVTEILSKVKDRFGISLSEVATGGGCMALEARLESGHWLVATDEGLMSFRDRIEWESTPDSYNSHYSEGHQALGWSIGIYPHNGDDQDWFGVDSIVDVIHLDGFAEDLPEAIAEALQALVEL